ERDLVRRSIAFYEGELFLCGEDGGLTRIDVPRSAEPSVAREWLTIELREEWTPAERTFAAGSLLAVPVDDYLAGSRELHELYVPTETSSLAGHTWTRHHLVLNILDDVTSRLEVLTPGSDGAFARTPL